MSGSVITAALAPLLDENSMGTGRGEAAGERVGAAVSETEGELDPELERDSV